MDERKGGLDPTPTSALFCFPVHVHVMLCAPVLFFFHLAVELQRTHNEAHLSGRAHRVQRPRRLMADQSRMTHPAICDPRG